MVPAWQILDSCDSEVRRVKFREVMEFLQKYISRRRKNNEKQLVLTFWWTFCISTCAKCYINYKRNILFKLDGVALLITDPPTNSFITFFVKKNLVTKKIWHVTSDMWHMTRDTWHMTCDTWRWGHVNLNIFSQRMSDWLV